MAHKPSSKTRRMKPDDTLNLTPMIDIISNLMFFLMMFASILPVVIIDAPLPKVASTGEEVRKAKEDENKMELIVEISGRGFVVKGIGPEKSLPLLAEGKYPFDELHKYLVELKAKAPKDSREITLMPADDTNYETMINTMDAARELSQGDTGYQPVPPEIAQKPEREQFNRLFPDVSIGGV